MQDQFRKMRKVVRGGNQIHHTRVKGVGPGPGLGMCGESNNSGVTEQERLNL